jgi:hypothetical protein
MEIRTMADGFYQYGMQAFARGQVAWKAAGGATIRTALVDAADYTVDLAAHQVMTSVPSVAREETSGNMTLVDAAPDGIIDANDVTFVGTAGDQCEGILMYLFVTADADSIPLIWWDSAAGLPVSLGGDISVVWPNTANKIAKI